MPTPLMLTVAGPPGNGKSTVFDIHDTGVDAFNVDDGCAELNGWPQKPSCDRARVAQHANLASCQVGRSVGGAPSGRVAQQVAIAETGAQGTRGGVLALSFIRVHGSLRVRAISRRPCPRIRYGRRGLARAARHDLVTPEARAAAEPQQRPRDIRTAAPSASGHHIAVPARPAQCRQ